jgi:hypothetical protein
VAAVVAVALVVRLVQAVLRWDEVALAYAAYTEPAVHALATGQPGLLPAAWVGLHPPLHAAWMAAVELIWPAPWVWLGSSVLCSTVAVGLVGWRFGPVGAAVLASAPLQVAYAAELNNYPLAVAGIAALVVLQDARRWLFLAAVGLACYAHVLGAAAAGGAVLWRLWVRPEERVATAAWSVVLAAPVVAGALRLTGGDGTFVQPAVDWSTWGRLVASGIGPVGLVLGVGAGLGLVAVRGRAASALLSVGLPVVVGYLVALRLGAAAPHQLPYLVLAGPVVAAAAGRAVAGRSRWLAGLVVALCALRLVGVEAAAVPRLQAIHADLGRERAVDLAVSRSAPGDVLWLVAPALQADDDKTDTSPVLWRLGIGEPMPMERWESFDYLDWRFGQPRQWRGRVVHTSTELAEPALDLVVDRVWQRGGTVWVVLYDHGPATGLAERVERAVRPWSPTQEVVPRDQGLGDDVLYVLRAEAG